VTTVLVVDDDPAIQSTLAIGLRARGYDVLPARDGRTAVEACHDDEPDVVLLDLGLPDLSGVEVLRKIREWSQVPVIVLSARHGSDDKVEALDVGADDYVTKPFSIGELVARINAIFRRLHRVAPPNEEIRIGAAVIDPLKHELVRRGKTYPLTFYEVELLRLLWERTGQPVPREEILEKIWAVSGHATTRSVDNFVVKLRKKIEENAAKPRHIVTIYGTGYKLVP
jgi:DNA-binding response OmpR family regulator